MPFLLQHNLWKDHSAAQPLLEMPSKHMKASVSPPPGKAEPSWAIRGCTCAMTLAQSVALLHKPNAEKPDTPQSSPYWKLRSFLRSLHYKIHKCQAPIGYSDFRPDTAHKEEAKESLPGSKSFMAHTACVFKPWTTIFTGGICARRRNRYSLQLTVSKTLFQGKGKPALWSRHLTGWVIAAFPYCLSSSPNSLSKLLIRISLCLSCGAVPKVCLSVWSTCSVQHCP